MNSIDDLFHLYDDDNDLELDEWVDFDHLTIEMESKKELSIVHHQEGYVSQSLDPMMATTSSNDDDNIPSYLSNKKGLFDQKLAPLLQRQTTSITMDNLREMAVLIHHIRSTKLLISEWQLYLSSGTGQIKVSLTETSNISIWTEEAQKTMIKEMGEYIDTDMCVAYTKDYLEKLNEKLKQFEMEKNQCQDRLMGYTQEMDQKIEQFIFEQHIKQADLRLQHKMIVIEHQHRNRILELDFEALEPQPDQLYIYRKFYEINCEYERNKFNVDLLKQYVFYKQFPPSVNQQYRLPIPKDLQTIIDPSIRSTLLNRYERMIQQTKSDLILIHLSIAEEKLRQSREIFEQHQQQLHEQHFTFEMIHVLERRFKDDEERLQRLYQLKLNFFVKAPTMMTNNL